MVNDPNDIDRIFKDRFDGLKDRSIDPAAQWQKFESSLNAADGPFHASQQAGSSSSWVLSTITGVAAAGTSIIIVAGIFSGDSVVPGNQQQVVTESIPVFSPTETPAPAESESDRQTAATWPSAVENNASPSIATAAEGSGNTDRMIAAGAAKPGAVNNPGNQGLSGLITTFKEGASAYTDRENAGNTLPVLLAESERLTGGFSVPERRENSMALLPTLTLSATREATIVERDAEIYEPSPIASWEKDYQVYVRGGVRLGNGESNTIAKPALWSLNGLASVGYAYALTDRSFLTFELGFLRRSGNSLERLKEVDFSPIVSVMAPQYGTTSDSHDEPALAVHESLITTRLNYLHMPASVHFMIDRKWNASAGGFCDYLLWAQNESYRVFNSTSYVANETSVENKHTKEGLNKIRYGVTAGVEYTLNSRTVISFNGMIPLNNIMTEHPDYQINTRTNQLLDFHVGFRRQII